MLKKILFQAAYLSAMLALGFVIYYFFLAPKRLQSDASANYNALSTQAFFAANLPNELGVSQALKQYKGKIIILNFWATWCSPCRDEMPELSQLYTQYQNKNVVVLGVAIDEPSAVKTFTQSTPVSYPILVSEDEGMALGSGLGNDKNILPYTVIINTDGLVVKNHFGRINKALLESDLSPLLAHN